MEQDLQVDSGDRTLPDVPDAVQPPKQYPKWPWALAAFLMAIGIGVTVASPITVPYYTLSPGPVYDTSSCTATVPRVAARPAAP